MPGHSHTLQRLEVRCGDLPARGFVIQYYVRACSGVYCEASP